MACLIALCSLTFAACGGGTSQLETPGALNAVSGTLIDGNINAGEGGLQASVLVFAFADLPERADVTSVVPISVGIVGADGGFVLSSRPAGRLTLVFLADEAQDGVIDHKDSVAVLADPDQQLAELGDGDRVRLVDVVLNFRIKKAIADGIEVTRSESAAQEPVLTPTSSAG